MSHFNLKSIIGLGVGAGANILARFALANPDKVSRFFVDIQKFALKQIPPAGWRPLPNQLQLDPGRLDRVGLPAAEHAQSPLQGHDPGRAGLSDVAPLWPESGGAQLGSGAGMSLKNYSKSF